MSTDTLPVKQDQPFAISPIEFEATKDELRALVESSAELTVAGVTDTEGIAAARTARLKLKDLRVKIEKRRKGLKADSIEYGKKVDSVAKELTAIIEPEEKRLEHEESVVKREQERLEREAKERREKKIRQRLEMLCECSTPGVFHSADEVAGLNDCEFDSLLDAQRAAKREYDERMAAETAERQRIEEANRLEAERLSLVGRRMGALAPTGIPWCNGYGELPESDWDRFLAGALSKKRKLDEEAAEEQAKLDRQRTEQAAAQAKIDAELKRIADEEAERKRRAEIAKAQEEAAERARREEQQRQEREANEALARAEAEMAAEARKPDRDKLIAVAEAVDAIAIPELANAGSDAGIHVRELLSDCAFAIREVASTSETA